MSSRPELRLAIATTEAARYACEKWHYSKSYPIGKSFDVGVWEGKRYVGVIQFRNGANMNMSKPYGLTQWQCVELSRVALSSHHWPVSRMIAIALRMMRTACKGIRLVVSYADTMQDHHGGIYQAGGWVYTGVTGGDTEYRIGGKWRKARNFRSSDFSKYSGMDYSNLPARKTPGKHRYLMPLDDEMRQRIEPLRKPYPKRERSAENGTPGIQSGGGGVNPTRSLQVTGGKEE